MPAYPHGDLRIQSKRASMHYVGGRARRTFFGVRFRATVKESPLGERVGLRMSKMRIAAPLHFFFAESRLLTSEFMKWPAGRACRHEDEQSADGCAQDTLSWK